MLHILIIDVSLFSTEKQHQFGHQLMCLLGNHLVNMKDTFLLLL